MMLEWLLWFALLPAGQDCGAQVCLYASDAGHQAVANAGSFKPGARLSRKQRAKEAKANRKRAQVVLGVELAGGRGSVFVDGRYLARTGPYAKRMLAPGKHELEVREGDEVLTLGVLSIPRGVAELEVVVHSERE